MKRWSLRLRESSSTSTESHYSTAALKNVRHALSAEDAREAPRRVHGPVHVAPDTTFCLSVGLRSRVETCTRRNSRGILSTPSTMHRGSAKSDQAARGHGCQMHTTHPLAVHASLPTRWPWTQLFEGSPIGKGSRLGHADECPLGSGFQTTRVGISFDFSMRCATKSIDKGRWTRSSFATWPLDCGDAVFHSIHYHRGSVVIPSLRLSLNFKEVQTKPTTLPASFSSLVMRSFLCCLWNDSERRGLLLPGRSRDSLRVGDRGGRPYLVCPRQPKRRARWRGPSMLLATVQPLATSSTTASPTSQIQFPSTSGPPRFFKRLLNIEAASQC